MTAFVSTYVGRARRPGQVAQRGVRFTGLALPQLPAALRQTAQDCMIAVAAWWRKERSPAHFSVQAYDLYGGRESNVYEERKGPMGWMVRNGMTEGAQRQGGRVRPLFRTGRLRQLIVHGPFTAQASGSASRLRVRAWWPGLPRYTYYYDPNRVQRFGRHGNVQTRPLVHNKVAELTVVTEREVEEMRGVYSRELGRRLKALERSGNSET